MFRIKTLFNIILLLLCFNIALTQAASSFSLDDATINKVQLAIKQHQLTCEQLVNAYLERIKKYNLSTQRPAPFNAITQLNPSVLDEAKQLDAVYASTGKLAGPLHCVTVILKDNIDSFDTTTTAGSFALLGNQPNQDAFLVARLRAAGAIILGKGGMDEFAWGMFGFSSRSGRIGNAYDTAKNPGGSSGGPAVSVSTGFALIGIGTDNSGSVRIPAAFNGIVGLRPTMGLISQRGIFPMGNLDGTAGPLTRNVEDLATVLEVIAQPDQADAKTLSAPRVKSYRAFLNTNGLVGKRIGIVHLAGHIDTFTAMPNDIHHLLNQTLQTMQQLGASVTDNIQLSELNNDRELNQTGERDDVNAYLSAFPATRKNADDICLSDRTKTFGNPRACLSFWRSLAGKDSIAYQQALTLFRKNRQYIMHLMETNHLDALLVPISTQGSATYDAMTVNTWRTPIASNAGLPAITIHLGYDKNNMPVSVELIGKAFDEGTLIAMAYALQTHSPARRIPSMPAANMDLLHYSIPALNNLYSLIGKTCYDEILYSAPDQENLHALLTPTVFGDLVRKILQQNKMRS